MVLPVGVGIDGGVASGIVAPFVDLPLREAGCLSVGNESGVLDLHEIGIVGDEVEAFCHGLERYIAAVCDSRRFFSPLACGHEDDTIGGS